MTLESITEQISQQALKAPSLGKSIKLNLDEGVVHIDLTGETAVVTNEDKDADCIVSTSIKTLLGLKDGSVNPMMAMMSGKIKIKGDMGLAMKLQSLVG